MKIGEFFEKNVQWFALGLAAIWLLWVGWSYGVNRPEVEIGGTKFSPGSVDEYIRDNDANALSVKISSTNMPPGLVDVPDFTDAFVNSMNGQTPTPMTAIVVNSPPPYQEVVPNDVGRGGKIRVKGSVKELPEVTAPTDVIAVAGRSQVIVEPPKVIPGGTGNAANGNAAPAEGAARPNIFDNAQPQPAAAAAAAAAAPLPGQPAGVQMDKTWVSVFAKLNFTDQDSKFGKANVPPSLVQKQYIEVQLQRQEVLPDGTFGTIEVVKGLPRNQPPVDRAKPTEFVKWSADPEAQKQILAPPFYFVVKGTAWEIPRKDVPAVAQNQQQAFDLQQKYQEYKQLKTQLEKNKFTDGWTNEQKAAFYTFRIAEEKKENAAKAPQPQQSNPRGYTPGGTRGAPGGPGGGGGGRQIPPAREGRGDAVDPALLREMYADDDPGPGRRRPMPRDYDVYMRRRDLMRRNFGDDYMRRPMYNPEEGGINPNQQQILGSLIPDATGNVDIWAHDETAQPGRTYRYRLRATLKNPIFDTKNYAADPNAGLEKPPYLPADLASGGLSPEAAWSNWSSPIAIPTNVDMMLVSAQTLNGREVARFRVKRFQEGQINEAPKPFEVAPGDTIGGPENVNVAAPPNPNGGVVVPKQMKVDFTTNWMLVDIRPVGNDYRVRIMDPQGRIEVRTLSGDRNKFKDEPAKAGAAAAQQVGMVNRP